MKPHEVAIKDLMTDFFRRNKGMSVVTQPYPHNVKMANQKPISSDPIGRRKLSTGRDTITLYIQGSNSNRIVLARLHEEEDNELRFENIALDTYLEILPIAVSK